MREKKLIYGIFCFVSGVLFASFVLFHVVSVPKADADSGMDCMKTDLNARGYRNTMPSPTIDIVYEIPACMRSYGYTINNIFMHNGMVAVSYAGSGSKTKGMGPGDTTSGIVPF